MSDSAICTHATTPPILINTTNLSGQICGANIRPSTASTVSSSGFSIATCCDEGAEVRVQDDCTQFCKYGLTEVDFRRCVAGLFDGRPKTGLDVYCEAVDEGIGGGGGSSSGGVSWSSMVTETVASTPTEVPTMVESTVMSAEPAPPSETGAASHLPSSKMAVGILGAVMAVLGF
ncbi:hypothetical protein EJ05DRAFT_502049 [Pseudovirgaria hyperparasitica]|uniref:Uncharacterized protein n=1 Tax=Pseudovirgaria hyperparasitica TaxID=470096 RepID=A0A6A6W3F2_9PEZI|nr:uncharacterized protein EJ05DRAFT_502049 [Pseudovirgaria hyperparasitica]KAF2756544.1 hypothetical protein EJ05DRAFT_502049 [Pseudovirgaria hyperparasitica]